jgi:murein DD-endopeptidase MepM/ murein hydrolase activator NlpD
MHFEIVLPGDALTETFLDLWEISPDSTGSLSHVASADSGARSLSHTPRRPGTYLFRAQPELLRGGRFRISLSVAPLLAFPVGGRTERDVGSRFGAPRDGGRRSHHGIDIFAPRGTPAVAGAAGVVRRVEATDVGGNVVWLRDDRGHSLYYAHLDRSTVAQGARVAAGDTIGYVGNTGNARTTPPHLHFGIYARGEGPVDPWWFVRRAEGRVPPLVADSALFGSLARTVPGTATLRAAPGEHAPIRTQTPTHTALRVLAGVGAWYHVRLPDGMAGYLPARQVEPVTTRVASARSERGGVVFLRPDRPTPEILAVVAPGDSVDVLGRFGAYQLVRMPAGAAGWMAP